MLEEYSSTQSGLANFTIAFHVAPFQASSGGGSRRVSVKLMDASNIYQDIGSPIEVQAGAALEEGDAFYYFAAVHSASGKSRNITGPNHIRNSIKFNKDPSFAACQAQELSLGVYPSYPYIYTCVQLRTLTGSPTTGKINWFQYFSSSSSSVVVKIKYVVPSSPATNGSYQLYLTSNTLVSNQITSYTPSKFLLLSIDVASSNSSSSPTDQYTFSLMDKNSCKYSSPPGCLSAIQELAVQSVNRSDIDIFDGSFHSFKVRSNNMNTQRTYLPLRGQFMSMLVKTFTSLKIK